MFLARKLSIWSKSSCFFPFNPRSPKAPKLSEILQFLTDFTKIPIITNDRHLKDVCEPEILFAIGFAASSLSWTNLNQTDFPNFP